MSSSDPIGNGKRPPGSDDDYVDSSSTKKSKKVTDTVLSNVMHYTDEDRIFPNRVSLSERAFEILNSPDYIKVGRFVFPAHVDDNLQYFESNYFELTKTNIEDSIVMHENEPKVWISDFTPTKNNTGTLSSVRFSVTAYGQLKQFGDTTEVPAVSSKSIMREVVRQWKSPVLRPGQSFFLNHPVIGPLCLDVDKWALEEALGQDPFSVKAFPNYGCWNSQTKMDFISSNTRSLTIFDEIESAKVKSLTFKVEKVREVARNHFSEVNRSDNHNAWKRGVTPIPFAVPINSISRQIKKAWNGKLIYPGRKIELIEGEWKYTLKVTEFKAVRDPNQMQIGWDEDKNQKAFTLNHTHAVKVVPGSSVLLTKSQGEALFAQELTFQIMDYDFQDQLEKNEIIRLSVDEVASAVQRMGKPIADGAKLAVKSGDKTFLIRLRNAKGDVRQKQSLIKNLWKVNDQTKINIYAESELGVEVIDSKVPFNVDALHLIISNTASGGGGGIMAMLMGGAQETPKEIISEREILATFKDSLPTDQIIHDKSKIEGTTAHGIELEFKFDSISSSDKGEQVFNQGCVYKITPDTVITMEGEKEGGILIDKEPKAVSFNNVEDELIKRGIGGLTKPIKEAIQQMILSRDIYKNHIKSLGVTPQRGFLLYGPPGTGKTKLARVLGDILNVSEERIQFYTGSEVWTKYLGDSEKKVREMFKYAREDQKRYGDKSPKHMLIIDEIDAFLQDREKATRNYQTSVLNTFLSELDGISSTNKESLDNIIVVGLTNYPDKLDKAVTRDGRLGVHIHIGLPNHAGRKEIFEIHARKIIDSGYVADDVDFDKLANLTRGKTGSFIEAVVQKATLYHLPIVHALEIPQEQLIHCPEAKISMSDFLRAIPECINTEKASQDKPAFVPSQLITLDSLTNDLRSLGMVGVSENMRQFLFDIKLSQHYQLDRVNTHQELPGGVLLYGPPGTGKSSLGRSLGKLFGLDANQFQHYTASQLMPKGHQDLKQTLEQKIQPAISAAKDLEGETPLHIVVVDELEWLYNSRVVQKDAGTTLMAQFMREVSTLFHNNGVKSRNLIVIGIAQHSAHSELIKTFNLDSPAKLVAIDYPKAQARNEILHYYLEDILKAGRVEESTLSEMVSKTKDKSGSFIEKMVKEAVSLMYRRCSELLVAKEDIAGHKAGRLTLSDLDDAYRKIAGEEMYRLNYL